ncbi:hypothetical protein K431DRAFT_285748 [Polychaeton citri CBS 116435]|uniref:Afadin and alpha-actinin-binding-domain-containing protein n=1 Tax=Polychaeton citri CBS 116435 TaxID=1314669 RepID=A0A9P4UP52_9PEZI|nr:hypothetical protein K431DRAFT_285748 [Polychaeton citri CBS 116435]
MDSESLRTASTYLNNLLLTRGLLRSSAPIDFVKPSKESRAQIINLVHDLILRADRDKEQREQVAVTIRILRAEDTRKDAEIERLGLKSKETARAAVAAQTGERQAKEDGKTLERQVKSLQEQAQRLKVQLAQVRTQCANDVKKRDLELQRLKGHLQGQQRGNRAAVAAPSISMVGGRFGQGRKLDASVRELNDPEYSLRQETTEFLTQLSQSLSEENDGLISLVRHTLKTTRQLLGLPTQLPTHPDSAIGSAHSSATNEHRAKDDVAVHTIATSYETLAEDMEGTLDHLKHILTNPNFVPLSEVEEREDEIIRLRQGWEMMEARWRDILIMMQGWQKRINTGETINLDDLRRGMGLASPHRQVRLQQNELIEDGTMLEHDDEELSEGEQRPSSSSLQQDQAGDEQTPATGTAMNASSLSKRKRNAFEPPDFFDLRPSITNSAGVASPQRKGVRSPVRFRDEVEAFSDINTPSLDNTQEEAEPEMTIQEKLAAVQQEAEAISRQEATRPDLETLPQKAAAPRVAAASRLPTAGGGGCTSLDGSIEELNDDTLGKLPSCSPVVKKTKIRGRPKRRSTLSREEMAALVLGRSGEGQDEDPF